jgi:phosphoribosylformylglycinamidine synthase
LKFVCTFTDVRGDICHPATSSITPGTVLRIPINHFEGCFTCGPKTLAELRQEEQVVFRYIDNPMARSTISPGCVQGTNVGLMPHPERATHEILARPTAARCCPACWRR